MADLVFAAGTSHSPALNSPAEEFALHAERDRAREWHLDKDGNPVRFDDLVRLAPDGIEDQLTPEIFAKRVDACNTAIERLGEELKAAALDALIIVGDDQKEQYQDDNMPAVLIYTGETLTNIPLPLPKDAPAYWRAARQQYHEQETPRDYAVDVPLAQYLLASLISSDFDISHAATMNSDIGEGHAFGFVHRRLYDGDAPPVVPLVLNTYYPPNQPRPARCYALGRAIRAAIESWEADARIGIIGSGGLSHFTVDEALDRAIMEGCATPDPGFWQSIPTNKLNSGNSEIRNWVTVAGAAENMTPDWQVYEPCYRSEAGTGCGMAFAVWRS